ncbi:MAG: hypothetical protein JXR61_11350 [Prolixibacteraceae bacterium]|nr:hypothetical protein [Prolixibacteraceae bacterium]
MIFSKLTKFAGAILVLALTTGTLSAQRGNGRNAAFNGQKNVCLNQISGLTTEQSDKIRELNDEHETEMAQLRNERRSETDFSLKAEIRTEMLNKVESHRSEIKNLLTAEQQKEFDSVQRFGNSNAQRPGRFARGDNGNFRSQQGFRGNGNNRGSFNGNGQGKNRNQNFRNGYRGGFNSSNS